MEEQYKNKYESLNIQIQTQQNELANLNDQKTQQLTNDKEDTESIKSKIIVDMFELELESLKEKNKILEANLLTE